MPVNRPLIYYVHNAFSTHSHGNPSLALTNLTGTTASNSGGLTLSLSANNSGLTNIKVSAGTTSNLLSAITFSNANGVSFGLNGSVLTGSANTHETIAIGAGTQDATSGYVYFQDSNGLTFGLATGGGGNHTLTASHNGLTTAMASNRGSDFVQATAAFAGTNASGTIASNGISVSVAAPGAGGGAALKGSGTYTQNTGTVEFANSNGITFGLSNNGTMTASHNGLTTAMASNRGSDFVQATAAFAGTSASGTIASNGISVSIGPYITTAMLSNAVTLSNIRVSAGTTSNLLSAITFANGNGITFGINTSVVTASHNGLTTARASTDAVGLNTAQTNVTWTVNSSGISINAAGYAGTGTSATNASVTLNSNGLAISVAAPGGGAANTLSYVANAPHLINTITFTNMVESSFIAPFDVPNYISGSWIRIPVSISVNAASSTAATTGGTSYSAGQSRQHQMHIYSRGTGASSQSLIWASSTVFSWSYSMTQSHAANSTQHSYGYSYTLPCSSGQSTASFTHGSSAASLNYHTSFITGYTGLKVLEFPFAMNLTPGRWYLAWGMYTAAAVTQRTADQSRAALVHSFIGMSAHTLAFGTLGGATNSSVNVIPFYGSFTNGGGISLASIDQTRVSSRASNIQPYFMIMRVA